MSENLTHEDMKNQAAIFLGCEVEKCLYCRDGWPMGTLIGSIFNSPDGGEVVVYPDGEQYAIVNGIMKVV